MSRSMIEHRAANTVVSTCANVEYGEQVLVITDPGLFEVGDKIAAAAHTIGAEVVINVMPPREWDGQEPPSVVTSAMTHADVIIFPTVKDIAHSTAMKEALQAGARAVSMAGCGEDILRSAAMEADFVGERSTCDRAARLITDTNRIHVTSPSGTNVTFSVEGRGGNSHSCVVDKPGTFTGVPNIEANTSPLEETTEGTIVFDASIPNLGTGLLSEPVQLKIEKGVVTRIEGGKDAKNLERMWAEQKDPNVYNVAQFAMGMNPMCREANGGIVNDHGVYGTVHFGIGTSSNLGGTVKATGHIDGVMNEPRVEFDGALVLDDRTYLFDEAKGQREVIRK